MTATAQQVLDVIRGYLGVAEDPPHSNQTIIGVKFGWNGVPWCAETVSVCQTEAGNEFKASASCSQLVAWYRDGSNGTWLGKPDPSELRPGDEFFLGSAGQDHTGLVESVNGSTVITVEGNWGDKVARVSRPISVFYGFGRPNYSTPTLGEGVNELTDAEMNQLIQEIRDNAIAVATDVKSTKSDVDTVAQKLDQVNQRLDQIIRKVGA